MHGVAYVETPEALLADPEIDAVRPWTPSYDLMSCALT